MQCSLTAPKPGLPSLDFRKQYADYFGSDCHTNLVAANLAHMERAVKLLPAGAIGLEIGCFKGGTTVWLLENGLSRVDVIDPFTGNPEHKLFKEAFPESPLDLSTLKKEFAENTRTYGKRVSINEGRSADVLPKLVVCGASYDFIYVDGSHDSRDVILDAVIGFKLLKPGGVMVFDDYEWNFYDEGYRNPGMAIDFLLGAFAGEMRVLERCYQVSIQKL